MIGIPLGLLYGNVSEWAIHKYVLHEKGKNKKHFLFSLACAPQKRPQEPNHDWDYREPLLQWHAPMKEIVTLGASTFMHLPTLAVTTFDHSLLLFDGYYWKHKKAHA